MKTGELKINLGQGKGQSSKLCLFLCRLPQFTTTCLNLTGEGNMGELCKHPYYDKETGERFSACPDYLARIEHAIILGGIWDRKLCNASCWRTKTKTDINIYNWEKKHYKEMVGAR
jgi:hypothetical protein